MSNEKFKPLYTVNKGLSPKLAWINNSRWRLEFKGSCLWQKYKAPFTKNNVVNLFIVFELNRWSKDLNGEFTVKERLFGNVEITKNADPDKYFYSGYGTGFDSQSLFSISNFDWAKSAIILELI